MIAREFFKHAFTVLFFLESQESLVQTKNNVGDNAGAAKMRHYRWETF